MPTVLYIMNKIHNIEAVKFESGNLLLTVDALLGVSHQAPMIAAEEDVEYKTNNG